MVFSSVEANVEVTAKVWMANIFYKQFDINSLITRPVGHKVSGNYSASALIV